MKTSPSGDPAPLAAVQRGAPTVAARRARAARAIAGAEPVLVVAALLGLTAVCLRLATSRLLWYDELFTFYLSRFGSLSELWTNLAAGTDLQPPLMYVLARVGTAVFGDAAWCLRLPSVLSLPTTAGLLYLFVRRRRGPVEAAVAIAALTACGGAFVLFAEARPYGLMCALAAAALASWQRAAEGGPRRRWWWAALALTLGLGMATHYFFCVCVIGLGVAEVVRWAHARRIDALAVACFAVPVLVLLALIPLWYPGREAYSAGFWSKPAADMAAVRAAYNGLFTDDIGVALVFALAATAALAAITRGRDAEPDGYRPWESAALVAFAAGPALGVVIGLKLAGGYYFRYTIPSILGLAGLIALACGRTAVARWHGLVAAGGLVALGAIGRAPEIVQQHQQRAADVASTAALLASQAAGAMVVIESADMLAQLAYYHRGGPARIVYVADVERSARYTQIDALDRGALAIRRISPLPVIGWDELWTEVAAGRPVYYYGRGDKWQWQWQELRARGAHVDRVTDGPGRTGLFRVTSG